MRAMILAFISLATSILLVAGPTHFAHAQGSCENLFESVSNEARHGMLRRAWAFGQLPAHTAVYKMFFRAPEKTLDPTRRLGGVLRDVETPRVNYKWVNWMVPSRRVQAAIQYLINIQITPFTALGELADFGLRKVTFERSAFNGFSKFILFIGISISAIDPLVATSIEASNRTALQISAQESKAELQESLATDFRYAGIADNLNSGKVDVDTALLAARSMSVNLGSYYAMVRETRSTDRRAGQREYTLENEIADFGESLFFRDIMQFVRNGITPANDPSVVQTRTGQLSRGEQQLLFQLVHLKMSDLQFLDHIFANGNPIQALVQRDKPYAHWDGLSNSYSQQLVGLFAAKKMSLAELKYLIQQDITNQYQFAVLSVVGTTKLDSEGHALTLNRARANILGYFETN